MLVREITSLAVRSFANREEAIGAVLDVLHRLLGVRTSFMALTVDRKFRVLALDNRGGCRVEEGDELMLEEAY
jgi:hypothetical protein